MKTPQEANHLTRREALMRAVQGALAVGAAAPVIMQAETPAAPVVLPEPEYVPENDYPFFGYEPGAN